MGLSKGFSNNPPHFNYSFIFLEQSWIGEENSKASTSMNRESGKTGMLEYASVKSITENHSLISVTTSAGCS